MYANMITEITRLNWTIVSMSKDWQIQRGNWVTNYF
jgi:hypothetical protein